MRTFCGLSCLTFVMLLAGCGGGGSGAPTSAASPDVIQIKKALARYNAWPGLLKSRTWFSLIRVGDFGTYSCEVGFARDFPGSVVVTVTTPQRWQQQLIAPKGRIQDADAPSGEGLIPNRPKNGRPCRLVRRSRPYGVPPVAVVLANG
jgi:hypothetical protein